MRNVSSQNQDNPVGIEDTTDGYFLDITFVTWTEIFSQSVCPCYKLTLYCLNTLNIVLILTGTMGVSEVTF